MATSRTRAGALGRNCREFLDSTTELNFTQVPPAVIISRVQNLLLLSELARFLRKFVFSMLSE